MREPNRNTNLQEMVDLGLGYWEDGEFILNLNAKSLKEAAAVEFFTGQSIFANSSPMAETAHRDPSSALNVLQQSKDCDK